MYEDTLDEGAAGAERIDELMSLLVFDQDPGPRSAHPAVPSPGDDGPGDLRLGCLSIQLEQGPGWRGAERFVAKHAAALGLEPEAGVVEFILAIWPHGAVGSFYVSNACMEADAPEWKRELVLRPVTEGPLAQRYGAAGQSLGLRAYRRQGKLVVKRFELTPHVPRRPFEALVSGPVIWNDEGAFLDSMDWELLGSLPFHRAATSARLKSWRSYLDWKVKLAGLQQVELPWLAWRWESDRRLAILIDEARLPERGLGGVELEFQALRDDDADATEGLPHGRLGTPDRCPRVRSDRTEDRQGWTPAVGIHRGQRRVVFQLQEDRAEYLREHGLPPRGQLISSIQGELAPLRNQKRGIDRLQNSQGYNPRIADFIFDIKGASVPPKPRLTPAQVREAIAEMEDIQPLNEGQLEAVSKALSAPDVCLIQGPPGTGKTTVIAVLCWLVVKAGGRVLVASQTNLAVDNALGRLSRCPEVRRLRVGNAGRVDEEYKEFLAEHVVPHWFASIGADCRGRLDAQQAQRGELAVLERCLDSLATIAAEHLEADAELAAARAAHTEATAQRDERRGVVEALRAEVATSEARGLCLAELKAWATGDGELPAALTAEDQALAAACLAVQGIEADAAVALAWLDQALAAAPALVELEAVIARAVPCCHAGSAAALGGGELARLRAEKARLADAEEVEDLRRLGAVNRRLRDLESDGWASVTGALVRAGSRAFGLRLPAALDRVVDSLKASPVLLPELDRLSQRIGELLGALPALEGARADLVEAWDTQRGQQGQDLQEHRGALERAEATLEVARTSLDRRRVAMDQASRALVTLRRRWAARWAELELGEAPPPSRAAVADARARVLTDSAALRADLAAADTWAPLQRAWIERLDQPNVDDRERLQQLYVRYANVVGMTCNEAGKRQILEDPHFRPFDMVIVDEVSKCTPTELILPMLLGKQAVLVGDHRQLPPMFRERDSSFAEAVDAGELRREDFQRFEKMVTAGLFRELFEQAPPQLRSMLWTQYRMHPQIMGAVNEFYEGRLMAGPSPEVLDGLRQHHLRLPDARGGHLLEPGQHLLWLDSSVGPDGKGAYEQQHGSSKANTLEVELVSEILCRLAVGLTARGYRAPFEREITRVEAGRPMQELLGAWLDDAPAETVAEIIGRRRVRSDGRAVVAEARLEQGALVKVDPRKEVGVVTFYGAQLRELRRSIDRLLGSKDGLLAPLALRSATVDRFQGMERDIIIASLVRSVGKGRRLGDFVRAFERINVGLSRARQLLVVAGASRSFTRAPIDLPSLEDGTVHERPVYANIHALARRTGGLRHASQLLS
jgi:hypothetical protein